MKSYGILGRKMPTETHLMGPLGINRGVAKVQRWQRRGHAMASPGQPWPSALVPYIILPQVNFPTASRSEIGVLW